MWDLLSVRPPYFETFLVWDLLRVRSSPQIFSKISRGSTNSYKKHQQKLHKLYKRPVEAPQIVRRISIFSKNNQVNQQGFHKNSGLSAEASEILRRISRGFTNSQKNQQRFHIKSWESAEASQMVSRISRGSTNSYTIYQDRLPK